MADYPTKDKLDNTIIAAPGFTDDEVGYPVNNKAGQAIIAAPGFVAPGTGYPTRDGLGNIIIDGTPVAPSPVAVLDPPVTTAMLSKMRQVGGYARLVEGYTGDLITAKRLSDNATQAFGANAQGLLDTDAIDTWRAGADVDQVDFIVQAGTGTSVAVGTIPLVRSNQWTRFGCSYDASTALLSRNGQGCPGGSTGASGAIKCGGFGGDVAAVGLEAYVLMATNQRKVKVPANDPVSPAGNATSEEYFTLATNTTNRLRYTWNSSFGTQAQGRTTNDTAETDTGSDEGILQQYAQNVFQLKVDSTRYYIGRNGGESCTLNWSAAASTDVAGGTLNNPYFLLGASINDGVGTPSATNRADALYGGFIICDPLTALEAFEVQSKLGLIGQAHLARSVEYIEDLFEEMFFAKDVDGSGNVAGRNGLGTMQWNRGTNAAGTNTTDFAYIDPLTGRQTIRINDDNNANGYVGSNNYGSRKPRGGAVVVSTPYKPENDPTYIFCVQDDTAWNSTDRGNGALGAAGSHHSNAAMWGRVTTSLDPTGVTGSTKLVDGTVVGDAAGAGGGNQLAIKYNINTGTGNTTNLPITIGAYSYGLAALANTDGAIPSGKQFDRPIVPHCPQNNQTYGPRTYAGTPTIQISSWAAPDEYDMDASLAAREPYMLQSDNYVFNAFIGAPAGHGLNTVAHNPNAAVCHSSATARLASTNWHRRWKGAFDFAGFLKEPPTVETANIIAMNFYKLT